ncbi:MAG: RluA family pseudouridine synthase [Brevinema sp.]
MPLLSEFFAKHQEYHTLLFTAEIAEQRIDVAASELTGHTRSALKNLDLSARVNGKEEKIGVKLEPGDQVEIFWAKTPELSFEAEDVPFTIIYKDSDLMIIDKPWGIVVHPAKGHESGTLANGVLKVLQEEGLDDTFGDEGRVGIVHRLDKDTRGLMIVALNEESARKLTEMFRNREIKKVYKAIIRGHLPEIGYIEEPIGRSPSDRKKMAVNANGRPARTEFKTLKYFNNSSLIACNLMTGRTHQIRAHMEHLGHAVVGDTLYGGKNNTCPLPGMALLAVHLRFKHPKTGEELSFTLPEPPAFAQYVAKLTKSSHI